MLQWWCLDKKRIHVVLLDNGRNRSKALCESNLPSLPCMAHTLQLVVNEGLLSQRSITDVVATARKIVGHFKHSTLAYSRLHDIQAQLGQPSKRLQQDVSTRWDSTYFMPQSLVEQRRALGAYAAEHDLSATLNAHQWGLIENVMSLLTPFEELTKEITFCTATAADVIPAITALKRLLEKGADTDRGKTTLLEAVQRRFSKIERQPLYTLATVIDPRYKNHYFSAEVKDQVKQVLLAMLEGQTRHALDEPVAGASAVHGLVTEAPSAKKPCSLLLSVHDEILKENAEVEQLLASPSSVQVQSYLSELPSSRSKNALAYWRINKDHFPVLAPLA
ncbi:zinc finger BED domain-containing protein 4-like [Cyprinus carpio]|uniref:Zinc finger BED domain-containing protein 4-like n=1 Tax=Cyprinus carpio TaxID=7962 RepID=A0A9Q9YBY0_CYPCA|nr:zinc finger BED domain-containing protein 4-like [Cyprinus carpio]